MSSHKLKDVGYDIQDLESDMKYMERKVEEINKADQEADNASQSRRGLKRWFHFCALSSEKRRRLLTSSQSLSLSTDDDIVGKISIIKQINSIESKLKDEIKLEEWFDQIALNGVYDPWELYVNGNISVVPIVGMGGIGKTTLAQFVFNNREIENQFDKKAWIYVSDHFDRFRIIKEMVDSFCIGNTISPTVLCGSSTTSLDLLERQLKRHLTGKKFLLVLDDVWSDEWQQLLSVLQSAQAQAVKIIVTCRDPKVLRSIDKENKIILNGLSGEDYWPLFVHCAFGEKDPDNYSRALHDIGECIVEKLKGSPLAAKTVGKLLGRSLTEKHRNYVLESELWKLETEA